MRPVAEEGRLVVAPRYFAAGKGGLCRKGRALFPVSRDGALDRVDIRLHAGAPLGEIDRSAEVLVFANGMRERCAQRSSRARVFVRQESRSRSPDSIAPVP
jgi:hypothetical protein